MQFSLILLVVTFANFLCTSMPHFLCQSLFNTVLFAYQNYTSYKYICRKFYYHIWIGLKYVYDEMFMYKNCHDHYIIQVCKINHFTQFFFYFLFLLMGKFSSPLRLEPRTSHKPSPSLYHLSQASRTSFYLIFLFMTWLNHIQYLASN